MMVGKRGGRASCAQDDINDLMTHLALQGKQVVRLKSGDPMIFGRAGEEIEHLEKAGIPVDVVPGITAGIALASVLGTSLTHRDMAQSVRFVTGCAKTGQLPSGLDWQGLSDPNTTTIFYMAGGTERSIGYCGRNGFGLMLSTLPGVDTLAAQIALYKRELATASAERRKNPAAGNIDIAMEAA